MAIVKEKYKSPLNPLMIWVEPEDGIPIHDFQSIECKYLCIHMLFDDQ